jgi:hypothetical protein
MCHCVTKTLSSLRSLSLSSIAIHLFLFCFLSRTMYPTVLPSFLFAVLCLCTSDGTLYIVLYTVHLYTLLFRVMFCLVARLYKPRRLPLGGAYAPIAHYIPYLRPCTGSRSVT